MVWSWMMSLKKGDVVTFTGCSQEQINWGSNDDPNGILQVGGTYMVERVEVHSQHTKIELYGINGRFNSVCFD